MVGRLRIASGLVVGFALTPAAFAQFNNTWVTFQSDPNRIQNPGGSIATQVTNDTDEKDYAYADVNHDGWTDLVVVRKSPAATTGKRVNQLLMNENGILVDRTAQYAVDSDVPGDFGFSTPTNDRDVQLVDLDGDGWLDMVTATTLSDGDPKYLSHPRVYHNKGAIGGVWQGFKYEDARIPQLFTVGGLPVAPRFCAVGVGDVTGDGFPDLYFSDYDGTETGITEPTTNDLNDRLLVNDGFGFFTDSVQTRMTAAMLQSAFGMACKILDMNGDGINDIVKATALGTPTAVEIAYNNPANVGFFTSFQSNAGTGSTYHVDAGDLNQDGKPDIIVSDDGSDFFRFNLGNDALGRVNWGVQHTYSFLTGSSDGGFAGNCYVVDFDNDGWNDTIHADFDVDVAGCSRRAKIYHNLGGTPGTEVSLREEAQQSGTGGWKGAVGLLTTDMTGTYDVAVFDIDNDGDKDLILGRCSGTFVWMNQLLQPPTWTTFCPGDGSGTACPCANESAIGAQEGCLSSLGFAGALRVTGIARVSADTFTLNGTQLPNGPGLYFQGTTKLVGGAGALFGDGLRCVGGSVIRLGIVSGASNASQYPRTGIDTAVSVKGFVASGDTREYQLWYRDSGAFCTPTVFNLTNAIEATWTP